MEALVRTINLAYMIMHTNFTRFIIHFITDLDRSQHNTECGLNLILFIY